jgi:hypothetical protein
MEYGQNKIVVKIELCYFDDSKWTINEQLIQNARSPRYNKKLKKINECTNESYPTIK